jgi:exosome complex protein LRP1
MTIDKAVANRFIKHAIAQAVRAPDQSSQPADQELTPGPSRIQVHTVPAGATNKMLARAEWEKQVQEAVEEGEEDLEVFDEAEDRVTADADVEMTDGKTSAPTPFPVGKGETNISSESHSGMSV